MGVFFASVGSAERGDAEASSDDRASRGQARIRSCAEIGHRVEGSQVSEPSRLSLVLRGTCLVLARKTQGSVRLPLVEHHHGRTLT
jgi:hypothetical protein